MRTWFGSSLSLAVLTLAVVPAARAAGPVVLDQAALALDGTASISGFVVAEDFVVVSPVRLVGAEAILEDDVDNDNGLLDTLDGGLSWAIYENGDGKPGDLLQSGRAYDVAQRDTGLQVDIWDVGAVRFALEPPVTLAPGTYWFALREGAWGTAGDSTGVYWENTVTIRGATGFQTDDEAPGDTWSDTENDHALALFGELPTWDQDGLDAGLDNRHEISNEVLANDFELVQAGVVSAADVWLSDNDTDDDGLLGSFSGVLGWGIYDDTGSGSPDTLIAFGTDSSPLQVDTGLQDSFGSDVVRVRFRFGRALELPAGRYWLAIREGAWGASEEATSVWWVDAASVVGFGVRVSDDTDAPGSWLADAFDGALFVTEEPIDATGFEAGNGCLWSAAVGPLCP
jgi:hypothetical protein